MRMLSLFALLAVVASALVFGLDAPARAEDEPAAPARPTLADLAWMVGAWQEVEGPSVFSETWLPAQGSAMAGVAHWTIDGKTRMYELMSMEDTPKGVVIHVRHFGLGLVPAPSEADGPVSWPLLSVQEQHAIFEHPSRAWPKRLEYRRTGDVLEGRLTGIENGRPKQIGFAFKAR